MSPKIHPFTVPEALQRGDRLSLTCSVFKGNKPIEISWSRSPLPSTSPNATAPISSSSSPLPPTVKPVQIDDFTSMLAVAELDLAHNGAYTCRAENAAGSAAHTALVRVNGKCRCTLVAPSLSVPPSIVPFPPSAQFEEGQRTRLLCGLARADPPVSFTWLKDGVEIRGPSGRKERRGHSVVPYVLYKFIAYL